jgi:membrane associated rhomboid family serine protease
MDSSLVRVLIIIFLVILGFFIPIGNDNSTVRRLPWVTFVLIGASVLIFYITLPVVGKQMQEVMQKQAKLGEYLIEHPELWFDEGTRTKLVDAGLMSKGEAKKIEEALAPYQEYAKEYQEYFQLSQDDDVREEFEKRLVALKNSYQSTLWYRFGFAPNGEWKLHQLFTSAFIHGGFEHLLFNMLFFFAVAFTLEDLWGRSTFLTFYLLGAAASCIPSIASPEPLIGIGASGAVSATMGAFLIRLPRAKVKLFVTPAWLLRLALGLKLTVFIPGYIYLVAYFLGQLASLYLVRQEEAVSTVGYSVRIAGFIFGAAFAGIMRLTKFEETHINPKIEAKVSFEAPTNVTQALEILDRGDALMAERKLKEFMIKNPDNLEGTLALIQVYQRMNDLEKLNTMYGRLIRHHLANQDKEAAIYAYDNLLQCYPDDAINVRIAARDWLVLCEFLREAGMLKEAAVEYERLVTAWPQDAVSIRAAVQGGEAAFAANDHDRALRLFTAAERMGPQSMYTGRIQAGVEKARRAIESRPRAKQPLADKPSDLAKSKDLKELKLHW